MESRGDVLVIEDQSVQRWVLEKQLGRLGYSVTAAASGEEALRLAAERRYDAVLTDCQLPGIDGYEVARRLRQRESAEERTVLIAVTASQDSEELEHCRAVGMDDVVHKPASLESLEEILAAWLVSPKAEAAVSARIPEPVDTDPELSGTVSLYLEEAPQQVDEMRRALRTGDSGTFQAAAHSLAGSSGVMRALSLADCCSEMEKMAERGDLESCAKRMPEVENGVLRAARWLKRLAMSAAPA